MSVFEGNHLIAVLRELIVCKRIIVSGKLPTYPSPKPTFCPKLEVSVDVGLREG